MKDWCEDWVNLYFIEGDFGRFEEAEQETQGRLQVAGFIKEKSIRSRKKERHWRKLGILEASQRQYDCGIL